MDSLDKYDSLERAKKLIQDNTPTSLRYACLELRYCIESICHAKLKLYEKHLTNSDFETWKPKKILETLQEYDPLVWEDSEVAFFSEKSDGTRGDFLIGGKHTNLPIGILKRHYYKLGRFLHIPTLYIHSPEKLWNMKGKFIACHQACLLLRIFLVRSKIFSDDDIRVKYSVVNLNTHQYLQVNAEGSWIDVDVWGKKYGIPFGQYGHGLVMK